LSEKERPAAIRRVIRQTELQAKATAPISTLSRGYRQRVGVAQALLHNPEILILDEPTNGLDPSQIEHMRELIRELGKTSTVIVSTHIMQEVEATCDRVLILRQGRLALDAKLDELTRGSCLLLSCSAAEDKLRQQLESLDVVQSLEPLDSTEEAHNYRIQVNSDLSRSAAEIAQAIVVAGWELYSLQPEERSLEKVFHDINAQEVIDHAA
jgi:ABC-2 type transport system ATP-binding protein